MVNNFSEFGVKWSVSHTTQVTIYRENKGVDNGCRRLYLHGKWSCMSDFDQTKNVFHKVVRWHFFTHGGTIRYHWNFSRILLTKFLKLTHFWLSYSENKNVSFWNTVSAHAFWVTEWSRLRCGHFAVFWRLYCRRWSRNRSTVAVIPNCCCVEPSRSLKRWWLTGSRFFCTDFSG